MIYQQWSKDTEFYDLPGGLAIEKAHWEQFAPWWTVYVVFKNNMWFRQSYEMALSVLKDADICYWVKKDGKRIGGVLIEPNYMNCLYLEPPFCEEYGNVVVLLKNLLLKWSDPAKDIIVGGSRASELQHYQRAGFRARESRRCMIRPTEAFTVAWGDEYILSEPKRESQQDIAKLFYSSFWGGAGEVGTLDFSAHMKNLEFYINHFGDNELLNRASTLIYSKETNELVGACLISLWEQWPLVYDVAVHPTFQGKGLSTKMIKKALTVLTEQYPVLRLFVTLGNGAELVYHKLGFMPGDESTEMVIPARA